MTDVLDSYWLILGQSLWILVNLCVFNPRCIRCQGCAILTVMFKACNAFAEMLSFRLLMFMFVLGASPHLYAADVAVRAELARAYGYVIGDVIEQRLQLDMPAAMRLDAASLPKPGKLNAWVELRSAEQHANTVVLRYQLMNSPRDVVVVFLPSIKLQFIGADAARSEVLLDAQALSISPLTKEETFARTGMEAMRPEREVQPLDTHKYERRAMQALAVAAVLTGLLGAWLWWRKQRLARGPFARAAVAIASLKAEHVLHAMIALHEAFNGVAGRSVFAQSLASFFVQQPQYAGEKKEIEDFFSMSRAQFFGQAAAPVRPDADQLEWIASLAKRLARIEKRHENAANNVAMQAATVKLV
jgi:mxaA protein